MLRRCLVGTTLASASIVVSLLFGTGCSSVQMDVPDLAASIDQGASFSSDTRSSTIGKLTATYPSTWNYRNATESSTFIYPDYGGMFGISKEELDNSRFNVTEALDELIDGYNSESGFHVSKESKTVSSIGNRSAFLYDMSLELDGNTYQGVLEIVMADDTIYMIQAMVPKELVDAKSSDISAFINGLTLKEKTSEPNPNPEPQQEEQKPPLEFGEGRWDSNSSYKRYIGSIKNVSDKTFYYIKVRGTFKDSNDNAVDTDWTYACGGEGLLPGETTTFTLSVKQDSRIDGIEYSVFDFSL